MVRDPKDWIYGLALLKQTGQIGKKKDPVDLVQSKKAPLARKAMFNNTWALSKFKFEFPYSIHFCPFLGQE
jgi:hypothetical protein